MPYTYPSGTRAAGSGPGTLETILTGAAQAVDGYINYQEKGFKREKDKIDMYVSLRKAGYSADEAHKAVSTGRLVKPLASSESEYDLDTKIKKATLEEKEASTKYKKSLTERTVATTPPASGVGYDKVTDIPVVEGYKRKVKQDKKTGKFTVEYIEKDSDEGVLLPQETPKPSISNSDIGKGKGALGWLSNTIGSLHTPAGAEEDKSSADTKTIQGVTYKRGSDGKWHKQS